MDSIIVISSLAAAGYIITSFNSSLNEFDLIDVQPRVKIVQLLITTLGAIMWPLIITTIMNQEWRNGILAKEPLLWLTTMWVMLLFVIDASIIATTPSNDIASAASKHREIKTTFLSIVSTVFALGVLLSNIAKHEKRSSRSAQICITGLLLGLAFAIPIFETEGNGFDTYVLLSVTKTACL